MKFRENLKKIQDLPLAKRKFIFWLIIIILGLILFTLWAIGIKNSIKNFPKEKISEEINFPELEEKIKSLPKTEISKSVIEEDLKKLEEIKKNLE